MACQSNKIPSVLYSLLDIIVMCDNDLVITGMNKPACSFFGWTNDEIRGKSINFLIPNHPLDLSSSSAIYLVRQKNSTECPAVIQYVRDPQATVVAWTITPVSLPHQCDFNFQTTFMASIERKLSLDDINCRGKRVFVRVDYNVPMDKNGMIVDSNRIKATLPTIRKVITDGGRVIIGSHLGRPKSSNPSMSLKHLLPKLEELFGCSVQFAPNALAAHQQVNMLKDGEVLLLENLRFYKGENSKNVDERMEMAAILSSYTDLFVCDAFGTAHRNTASMTGIPRLIGAGIAGYLMEREVNFLSNVMRNPVRPVVAVVGGSKVSDKIGLLGNLCNFCQTIVIGGAMAFTFLEAQGRNMGSSKVQRTAKGKGGDIDLYSVARQLLQKAKKHNVRLLLPVDFACAKEFKNVPPLITDTPDIPEGYMGLDVGPKTIEIIKDVIAEGRTAIWNGPLGVFEFSHYAKGSHATAKAISSNINMLSIVGGGETAACAKAYKEGITHISTGGGATLELLEGKTLPGLICLTSRKVAKF
eukprot:Tbor_TRINITY_DN5210_c2_g2::TRINITY_DN5210_c2_g2_i1::g.16216::m.16216/K00927/PGK, pgk; phosphoglycerate kinase